MVACSYGFSTSLLGIVLEWNGGAIKPKQFDGALASVKAWKNTWRVRELNPEPEAIFVADYISFPFFDKALVPLDMAI